MSAPFQISSRVIDTVNSLPLSDRQPIANALTSEFLLGIDPSDTLTPMQSMLYAMIRFYVIQDTERARETASDPCSRGTLSSFEPRRRALG